MARKIEPLPLPRALNRQGVDGAYLLLEGTRIDDLPQALDALEPNNAKLDEPHRAPVSGDHVRRWREQEWASPVMTETLKSIWSARGVAA